MVNQRKKIQKSPSRWESVETRVLMHSWKPEVYVDFPSLDATPSYYSDNKDYFETGYKYRIIIMLFKLILKKLICIHNNNEILI